MTTPTRWTRDTLLAALPRADLSGANIHNVVGFYPVVPEFGAFCGVKKLRGGRLALLEIPADSPRVGGYTSRKCRCLYALVREIWDGDLPVTSGLSIHDRTLYEVGAMVIAEGFDPDPRLDCAGGIHFFLTRAEAEAYT